jgi:hypothetical protein
MRTPLISTLALAAAIAASPVLAQSPDRLAALESRMQALEAESARLKAEAESAQAALAEAREEIDALRQAQAQAAPPDPIAADAPAPEQIADATGASGNANAFNPALSVVLDGQAASHSLDPGSYARAGFPLVGEGGPSARGVSLGESEMTLSANVDDKFYGQLTVAVESEDGEDGIGVEEAFVDANALPNGFALRMGRFLSNLGYLNSHHAHTDHFSDRPLAYQALLGGQYGDDGVQVRWVAPTDLFLELSGEVLRGEGFPAGGAGRGGTGARTLAAHLGGELGSESEWLFGVSALDARVDGGEDGFTGRNRLVVFDGTWKWAPQGNFKDGGWTVRAEYLREHRDGEYVDALDPSLDQAWNGRRAGAYLEAVYRINRQWEAGYRYDRLWADDAGPFASDHDPSRHSAVLTWMNSEFSLLRLMLAHDRPLDDASDDSLTLQYQVSFGAHGAHKF